MGMRRSFLDGSCGSPGHDMLTPAYHPSRILYMDTEQKAQVEGVGIAPIQACFMP